MRTYIINPNNIVALKSINKEYAKFPYQWDAATEQEKENIKALISDMVADCKALRKQRITDIAVSVSLHPNNWGIFTTLNVALTTMGGKTFKHAVGAEIDETQVQNIFKAFINAGLPGLVERYAHSETEKYERYLEDERRRDVSRKKADQIIALLENGMRVDDILMMNI